MTEGRRPPFDLVAEMARMDSLEAARRQRVVAVVTEITGETGTSREYGSTIELWEALARQKEQGSLATADEPRLKMAEMVIDLAFGKEGLVHVLRAWYGPALERRAAFASGQESVSQPPTTA